MFNDLYRKWVAQQPCVVTKQKPCDPHHIKGYGYLFRPIKNLLSIVKKENNKIPDWATIPLIHKKHTLLHHEGWKSFELKNNIDQRDEVIRMVHKAFELGIFVVDEERLKQLID